MYSALICRLYTAQTASSCAVQCTVHCLHTSALCIALLNKPICTLLQRVVWKCCSARPCFWHWVHTSASPSCCTLTCTGHTCTVHSFAQCTLAQLHSLVQCTALHRAALAQRCTLAQVCTLPHLHRLAQGSTHPNALASLPCPLSHSDIVEV